MVCFNLDWLKKLGIEIESVNTFAKCSYCKFVCLCKYKLELVFVTEFFCSEQCRDFYCNQMKDMII